MLLTRKIMVLLLEISVTGVVLSAQNTEKLRTLRNNRQAIYREFGFNSPIDILEEMCSLFARDPKNSDFSRQIKAGIEKRRLIFARYADALLASVKAGDLERPEEFFWAANWCESNIKIEKQLENLHKQIIVNIANAKDLADMIGRLKNSFREDLRNRAAECIGNAIMKRRVEQLGTVSNERVVLELSVAFHNLLSNYLNTEKYGTLREKRQAIYQKFGFDSRIDVIENMCTLFAIDPENNIFFKQVAIEIMKLNLLFDRYANALIASFRAGDIERPEEFFWAKNWHSINIWLWVRLEDLCEQLVVDIASAQDPADALNRAKAQFKKDIIFIVTCSAGHEILARATA